MKVGESRLRVQYVRNDGSWKITEISLGKGRYHRVHYRTTKKAAVQYARARAADLRWCEWRVRVVIGTKRRKG